MNDDGTLHSPQEERVVPADASSVRYLVVGALTSAAVLAYVCRNSIGVAESTIRNDVGLTELESGWFMGAFFWTYALLQVPAGWVGKRFGTRLVLGASAAVWSLAIAMIGLAPSLTVLIAAQMLMGVAQAGVFPCAVQSISRWMPAARRASSCAALTVGMQFGAIIAATLTGALLTSTILNATPAPMSSTDSAWRWTFLAYSLPGLVWAVAFWMLFRNRPEDAVSVSRSELEIIRGESETALENVEDNDEYSDGEPPRDEPTPWLRIVANRSIWTLCGQQVFRAAGYGFFATWFPTFLQKTRGISVKDSGLLQGSVFAATLIGSLAAGVVIDRILERTGRRWWSRSAVGAASMFCCSLLIFAAYLAQSTTTAIALITLGACAAACGGPCAYVATIDLGGRHVPTVFGLMNMSGNLAAAATPVCVGWFFSWTDDWNLILALFGGAYLLAALLWLATDPDSGVDARSNGVME